MWQHFKHFSNPPLWHLSTELFYDNYGMYDSACCGVNGNISRLLLFCVPCCYLVWPALLNIVWLRSSGTLETWICLAFLTKPTCSSLGSNLVVWWLSARFQLAVYWFWQHSSSVYLLWSAALLDPVPTWHHHRRAASTSCCVHQHAAHSSPAVADLTFSTIIYSLFINSLACSVCFISATLSPDSVQQQRRRSWETQSQGLNWRNKQGRKCLRACFCRPEICHVPWNIKGGATREKHWLSFSTCMHVGEEYQ